MRAASLLYTKEALTDSLSMLTYEPSKEPFWGGLMKIKIRNSVLSSVIGLVIISLGWIASASVQADFYLVKMIIVYAGTTLGDMYDQWLSIFALHVGKIIPSKY